MDLLTTARQVFVAERVAAESAVAEASTGAITHLPPGLVVVEVRGEVTSSFLMVMRRALHHPPESVRIDLTRVDSLGASGISALMELRRHCTDIAVRLSIVAPPHLRRRLELVGLRDMFTMSPKTNGALAEC